MPAGASCFPVDPDLPADQARVFWAPEIDPGLVLLVPAPPLPGAGEAAPLPAIEIVAAGLDSDQPGIVAGSDLRVLISGGPAPDRMLAALVILDRHGAERLDAVARLIRTSSTVPPDARLTRQRRCRLRQVLRALDGHCTGAAYRAIAEALFGLRRIAAFPWKTCPLRDTTIRLVRDGLALLRGGYRRLLRQRR